MPNYQELPEKWSLEPVDGFVPEPKPNYVRKGLGVIAVEDGYIEAPDMRKASPADASKVQNLQQGGKE